MPKFNIQEQQITSSGQTGAQKADPNLFAPIFQADRQIGAAAGAAAGAAEKIITEHLQKKAQARDAADISNGLIKYQESANAFQLELDNDQDFDTHEKRFEEFSRQAISKSLEGVKSKEAKNRLTLSLNKEASRAKLFTRVTAQKKETDYIDATHKLARDRGIQNGDLVGANDATQGLFDAGLILGPERDRQFQENEEKISFNNTLDLVRGDPLAIDFIIENNPQTEKNERSLRLESAKLVKAQRDALDKQADDYFKETMNTNFNLKTVESDIQQLVGSGYDRGKGAVWLSKFRDETEDQFDARVELGKAVKKENVEIIQARIARLKTEDLEDGVEPFNHQHEVDFIDYMRKEGNITDKQRDEFKLELGKMVKRNATAESTRAFLDIQSAMLLGKDDDGVAFSRDRGLDEFYKVLGTYKGKVNNDVIDKTLKLIKGLEKEKDTDINSLLKSRNEILKEILPEGALVPLFGEKTTVKEAVIARRELGEKISSTEDEDQKRILRIKAYDKWIERVQFKESVEKATEIWIRANSEKGPEALRNYIWELTFKRREQDAFDEEPGFFGKVIDFIGKFPLQNIPGGQLLGDAEEPPKFKKRKPVLGF